MAGQSLRYLLIFVLACPLADLPVMMASKGPAIDEYPITVSEDLATISLTYRQQVDDTIQSLAHDSPGLLIPHVPFLATSGLPFLQEEQAFGAYRLLSVYDLMTPRP
jgi:hypothetical protein